MSSCSVRVLPGGVGPAYVADAPRAVRCGVRLSLFAGRSPTFRHYAALRAGPRTSSRCRCRSVCAVRALRPCGPRAGVVLLRRPPRVRRVVGGLASAPCVGLVVESQGQLRLRRAGSESRGDPWRCLAADWFGGGGVRSGVLSSPGTGGNQEPAGTATGGGFRWLSQDFACRRLHSRQNPGRAAPARRREHPDLAGSARSAPEPTPQSHRDISHRTPRTRPTREILHQASVRAARFPITVHAGRLAERFCIGHRNPN